MAGRLPFWTTACVAEYSYFRLVELKSVEFLIFEPFVPFQEEEEGKGRRGGAGQGGELNGRGSGKEDVGAGGGKEKKMGVQNTALYPLKRIVFS